MDKMGIDYKKTYVYPKNGLKGYSSIMNRSMYVRVNGNLDDAEQKVSATHEIGHLIIHPHIFPRLPMGAFRDFELYSMKNRYESEANFFVADFLISDNDVMLFVLEQDMDFYKIARTLYVPTQILNFKLYSMKQRGLPVTNPESLESRFLK